MRKKIIAGNWKMNKTINESIHLVGETLALLPAGHPRDAVVIFCPPFISLEKFLKHFATIKSFSQRLRTVIGKNPVLSQERFPQK